MNKNRLFPKTAQFTDTYFPTVDGVVRTVHNYANYINTHNSYSCVIVPEVKNKNYPELPYDVIRAKSIILPQSEYSIATPYLTPGLDSFVKYNNFELFHSHSPFGMGHYALTNAKKLGTPIISTFHSKYYDDILQVTHSRMIAEKVVDYIVEYYNRVDEVWTVSNGTANTLRSYGYNKDIFVIDNGTDYTYPENPQKLKQEVIDKFNIPTEKPVLLFVGHQIWQKNLKLILDTAATLKNNGFVFTMLIVGEGYAAEEIKAYSASLNLDENHVRFLGSVNDIETMKGIYLASDLFFFPSIYDNSPLVLREASAMALPSLLMEGSNSAEKIIHRQNGLLTTNNAEFTAKIITDAFSSPDKLSHIGKNAKRTLCHSWDEIMPVVCERYNEITMSKAIIRCVIPCA